MIWRDYFSRLLICIVIFSGCIYTLAGSITYLPKSILFLKSSDISESIEYNTISVKNIDQFNITIRSLLTQYQQSNFDKIYLDKIKIIVDPLISKLNGTIMSDSLALSESCYYLGVYFLFLQNYYESVRWFNLSIGLKDDMGLKDIQYSKALYNLGATYYRLGDFKKHELYSKQSLDLEKEIFGESSPALVSTYSSLVSAYIQLQEYEKSINYSDIALTICKNNPDSVSSLVVADLYHNLGVCYSRLEDYSKAILYLDESESLFRKYHLELNENYINLLNNLAISYGAMKSTERSELYYQKGIAPALKINRSSSYNFINSYSIFLGKKGKQERGEALLRSALIRAKEKSGVDSRDYFEVLNDYAEYLREYKIDISRSLECYLECINYLNKNKHDKNLRSSVYEGYSLSLAQAGEEIKALQTIQLILFPDSDSTRDYGIYNNPSVETIIPDKASLSIYKAKYKILKEIYKTSNDLEILEAASTTSGLIVSLLEKVRINISEEDSRLVLGDNYRDSYLNAIGDLNLLYKKTGDIEYLRKAFEFSEKSKVAGLLTSTRELKASQFHIPAEIAALEKTLQRNIGLFNARIAEESNKEEPNTDLVNKWKENLLSTTRSRDSLISVFEERYPDYYAIKYNTRVAGLSDVPGIIGRNGNYINYVASDTVLYIFIVNQKYQDLLAFSIDTDFYNNIRLFRKQLSVIPSSAVNARSSFETYQLTGYKLYKTLIDPIKPFLISNQLFISPDNIISYLPLEAIPSFVGDEERIMYRNLHFLMDDFDISYTYSATFMSECEKRDYSSGNELIAFAPDYSQPIDIKSALMNRQAEMGNLVDLPFARQEAEYVSNITGGKLYENSNARESVFKEEAGKFDIIHLSMHTLVNDKDPMHSTLIFSKEKDTLDDSYLKTYEIYGIPLKAKMVVLSSCNTGTGILYSGEGIVSLARGFIYSGSQSVVMSMWEIEDKSGTEVMKMFYDYLKRGYSKSVALRKARTKYLKNADQLRSHPYFWSTLVIYGDNKPLYYPQYLLSAAISAVILFAFSIIYYFWRRKYS